MYKLLCMYICSNVSICIRLTIICFKYKLVPKDKEDQKKKNNSDKSSHISGQGLDLGLRAEGTPDYQRIKITSCGHQVTWH